MKVVYDENGQAKIIRSEKNDIVDETKPNPNKFKHIDYLSRKSMDNFTVGDTVWIEEKIDGTNISATIDEHGDYRCYGRRFEMGDWYSNRGAYEKLLEIKDRIINYGHPELIFYFEYSIKHHIKYDESKENQIYLIGIKDKNTGKYLIPHKVYDIAEKLDLEKPHTFYYGPFKGWDHVKAYVGKTTLGAKIGEGVVVKAYDKQLGIKFIKVVHDDFKENNTYSPEEIQAKMKQELDKRDKVKQIVTEARIRKQLFVLMDEGIIQNVDNITEDDKRIAIKNIGKLIYDDCVKEETEFVLEFGKDFGKYSFITAKQFIENL